MGMYTELQGTIVFKSEAIALAFTSEHKWKLVSLLVDSQLVKEFEGYSRSWWIPNGDIRLQEANIVQFHTELKNYDGTIEKFLELLPDIADDWILESRYEERSAWTLHHKKLVSCRINGDNSDYNEFYGKRADVTYPDFDVFNLENLDAK